MISFEDMGKISKRLGTSFDFKRDISLIFENLFCFLGRLGFECSVFELMTLKIFDFVFHFFPKGGGLDEE